MFWISSIPVFCFIRGWIHSPRFGSSKSDSTAKTPRRKVFSSERRRLPRHQHVKGGREGHLRRNGRLTSAMRDEIKRPCMKTKAIAIDNASKDDVRISASNGDCR